MKFQGSSVERFAKKPDPACLFALIFGDDEGVAADTASALIHAWERDQPSTVRTFDEDEVKRDPSLLFDALSAVSLLGDGTIIRIRGKGEKLFGLMKEVLELPPDRVAAKLILLNGSLNTRSKLRTAFEAAPNAAALHVFADTASDMVDLVRQSLKASNVEITDDALSAFVDGLPGHRSLANAEMEKLSIYAHGLGRPVSIQDVRSLCETNADESARRAVLLALSGEAERAQAELDRVLDAGLSAISLIRMFEMEATRMLAAQALQGEAGGGNIGMKLKPPVWKSDWPAFQTRLRKWPTPRLVRLMERLHDLERMAKSPGGSGLADPAMRALFVSLYKAAASVA